MFVNMPRRDFFWLLLLLGAQFFLQTLVYQSGFPGLSGDDFFRALMAYEWSESPFFISKSFQFCSIHWFPTHFWITGTVNQITKNLVFSLQMTSIFFHLLQLLIFFQLAKHLFNKVTGYLSILLIGFLPWQIWVGISMTEMTMYFTCLLGGFLLFIKWQKEKRISNLWGAALLFLIATMFRPESWVFASLFSFYLLMFLIQNRRTHLNRAPLVVSMILPSLFILFWLGYNFKEFGDPFYFLMTIKPIVKNHLDLSSFPLWVKGLQFPFLLFIVSPFLFVFILIGLIVHYRSLTYIQRTYLWFTLAQFAFMILATLYGLGTTAAPQRYVLIHATLLTPFAAYSLSRLWQKEFGKTLVISILFLYIGIGVVKSFFYPSQYRDITKVGKYLKDNFESGILSPSDQISSELAFRRITGALYPTVQDYLIQSSAHAALAVYSGRPRNFLFNILYLKEKEMLKDIPSARGGNDLKGISIHRSTLGLNLKEMGVTKIILGDRELIDWIPSDFYLEKTIGNYAIFSYNLPTPPLPSSEPKFNKGMNVLDENLGEGIILRAYGYDGGLLPNSLSLLWKLDKEYDPHRLYKIKLTFLSQKNPEKKFTRMITPLFKWYKIDQLSDSAFVEENIGLFLPPGMPNGEYSLKVSLMEQCLDPFPKEKKSLLGKELTLAALPLISSKRELFRDALRSGGFNWKLLMKTLIVL